MVLVIFFGIRLVLSSSVALSFALLSTSIVRENRIHFSDPFWIVFCLIFFAIFKLCRLVPNGPPPILVYSDQEELSDVSQYEAALKNSRILKNKRPKITF